MENIWKLALAALIAFAPCVAAAEDADALYKQAEEGEWYGKADMKEIDDLYSRAAEAGSPYAFMAAMRNRIAFADPERQNRLAEELCPKAREIVKKWQDEAKPAPEALYYLASYHSDGICANRDIKKARTEIARAAEAGYAKAQFFMGKSLLKKDPEAAFKWISKAADAGFMLAVARQASCYLLGQGTGKDGKKADELVEKALASGNSNAIYDIAIGYLDGTDGFEKNTEKGRTILKGLAERGYEPATLALKALDESKEDSKEDNKKG